MEINKQQRPRKPAQPIKVAGNTKTRPSGQSGTEDPEIAFKRDNKMFDGRDISKSYLDEVGRWR